jgi:TRAP-type transport system periplasmic protein
LTTVLSIFGDDMKSTKTLIALATTAALAAALATNVAAQDKPVELKFAHWVPASHPLVRIGYEPWAKSIEAASKGSIKITFYPAQQLGKAPDHYDMARDGIADISWINPGYQAGRFPVFSATELPMLISNPVGGSAAIDAWYRKYAAQEMKDVKFCMAHLHQGSLHSKKAITSPTQISGMKVRPANGTVAALVSSLGGTSVQVSAPEAREALERGVAEAITFPWESILSFKIDQAVKFHTDFKLYAATFAYVFNKPMYEKLSPAQKKIMDDHCTTEWATKMGEWGAFENAAQEKIAKMPGHTIVKVSAQDLKDWRNAASPRYDKWIVDAGKAGINAQSAIDDLRKELNKRNALMDK